MSLSNFPRSRVPQKRRLVVEKSSCRHCSCYRQESRAAPLSNFPRSRVPQKMGLVVVEGKCRCRRCSCYRQEDRAASLSNFPRSRVPQKMRLVVVEGKEDPSIPGSTGKATLSRRGREQSSPTWRMSARRAPSSRPLPLLFVAFLFLFVFPRPSPPWVINVIIIIVKRLICTMA